MSEPDKLDQRLDRLLKQALATYADPEVKAGLEGRILDRIRESEHPARRPLPVVSAPRPWRRWLLWTPALAAAALLLVLVPWFLQRETRPQRETATATRTNEAPNPPAATGPTRKEPTMTMPPAAELHPRRQIATLHATRPAPLPKLAMFPTPQPLTPEELTLVRFLAQTTPAERKAFVEAQKTPDAPSTIARIQIAPLQLFEKDPNPSPTHPTDSNHADTNHTDTK